MARKTRIPRALLKIIDAKIDDLFERLKHRALGPTATGKRLFITWDPALTLPSIYEQAVSDEGGGVDTDLVERLIGITNDYLDKYRSDAKAQVKKRIHDISHQVAEGQQPRS